MEIEVKNNFCTLIVLLTCIIVQRSNAGVNSEGFNCLVSHQSVLSNDDIRVLTATLRSKPEGPNQQYCTQEQNQNKSFNQNAEITCDSENVVRIFLSYGYGTYSVEVNCTADFPLDVALDPEMPIEAMNFKFLKIFVGHQTFRHEISVKFPSDDSSFYEKDKFAGNYTFHSASDLSVNYTVDLRIILISSLTPENTSTPAVRIYPASSTQREIRCFKDGYSGGEMYLSNAGGSNPTQTRLLYSCLRKGNTCKGKLVGRYCGGSTSFCRQIAPFNSHGVIYCSIDGQEEFREYFTSIDGHYVRNNMSVDVWNDKYVIELRKDDGMSSIPVFRDTFDQESFYETEEFPYECLILDYLLVPPVIWSIIFSNGSEEVVYVDYGETISKETKVSELVRFSLGFKETQLHSSHRKIRGVFGMVSVKCAAPYWNSNRVATAVQPVKIISLSESTAPSFPVNESKYLVDLGSPLKLNCTSENGIPASVYSWEFVGSESTNVSVDFDISNDSVNSSVLSLKSFSVSMKGMYICLARNVRGNATHYFFVDVRTSPWIYFAVALGVVIVLASILLAFSRTYYTQRGRLSALEIKQFEKGDSKGMNPESFAHENAGYMPYDKSYEVAWKELIIGDEKLGEGAYGVVYKARLKKNSSPVAAKSLKGGVEKPVILALLSELKIMIYLGKHENIDELIGACTEFLTEGRVYVLVEYCSLGSLESYVRKNDKYFTSNQLNQLSHEYPNEQQGTEGYANCGNFDTGDLVNWAIQIARGMQYLQDKKVIHGDLATRNVLLSSMKDVKLSDFGLSNQLLNYDTYAKGAKGMALPWRWLALESLKFTKFTSKSDVWAYGVTLWEMFTLGRIPYPGVKWSAEFVSYLEDNLRLSQPKFAPDGIYRIMLQCWEADPENRPDFHELQCLLAQGCVVREDQQQGGYVEK